MSTSKGRKRQYEAMFLLSQGIAAELGSAIEHIREILKHGHAELVAMKKWDDRRLAFEIDKQKRGTYILAYFIADPVSIATIERDCNLSERIMRTLIVSADHLTTEEMQANDGQQALADEARLRASRPAEAPAAAAEAAV
ncbi:MAG: 30S ribosomal protein S6 [Phycisphaerales bacterium]|nr:30S ribosomal protein S6 [Phycisphaerales bacterium]